MCVLVNRVSVGCIKGLYQVRQVCVCACLCSACVAVKDMDRHTCSFMSGPGGAPLGRNVKAEERRRRMRRREVAITKSSLRMSSSGSNWDTNSTLNCVNSQFFLDIGTIKARLQGLFNDKCFLREYTNSESSP